MKHSYEETVEQQKEKELAQHEDQSSEPVIQYRILTDCGTTYIQNVA